MSDKYLIVGLGNPGRQYEKTRHNVGFWVVRELAQRYNMTAAKSERKAMTVDGIIKGKRVLLAMPQTYMNLSGEAVRALVDYYKVPIENFIVIHDDLDTPLGTLRLRKTGGHGGQNGIRNIILHLGTQDFARVRFGIGRPPGRMSAKDYVLQPFHGDDEILAQQITERAADAIESWLVNGIDIAMSEFNGDINEANNTPKASPKEELKVVLRAHELAPTDPKPLEKLAKIYRRLRQLDDAAKTYLKLGDVHAQKGKNRQQIAAWEQAVSIRPALVDLQKRIAKALEEQANTKRAAQRWIKLAEYHQGEGQISEANAAVEEALRINPQHPKALAMQTELADKETS